MLDLDDPRWGEIDHAYGNYPDTPSLLRMLEADPDGLRLDESGINPGHELDISLCHQGTPCSASYAAVPHIVRISSFATAPTTLLGYFLLPAMIERGRNWPDSKAVSADLADSYFEAIKQLPEMIPRLAKTTWNEETARAIVGALLSLCGQPELGEGIEQMRLADVRLFLRFHKELEHIADVKTWKAWDEFGDEDAPITGDGNL